MFEISDRVTIIFGWLSSTNQSLIHKYCKKDVVIDLRILPLRDTLRASSGVKAFELLKPHD
jgi:hypothetical protein